MKSNKFSIKSSIFADILIFILFLFSFVPTFQNIINSTIITINKIFFYIIFFGEILSAVILLFNIINPLDNKAIQMFRDTGKLKYSISCIITFIVYILMAIFFVYINMLFNAMGAVVVLVWLYLTYDKIMQTAFSIE